jgi:hypothetical protein
MIGLVIFLYDVGGPVNLFDAISSAGAVGFFEKTTDLAGNDLDDTLVGGNIHM